MRALIPGASTAAATGTCARSPRTRVIEKKDFPAGIVKLLALAPADAKVLLTGGLDGQFELLKAIGFENEFFSSPPEAVRKVRWPSALATIPTTPGLKHCKTLTSISFLSKLWRLAFGSFGKTKYLLKPRDSYGGQGITWWTPGGSIDANHYLQQYIKGVPVSAVYHCDGWSSILLGVTEQLIGEPCFGVKGFAYCGSVGPIAMSEKSREALSHLGVVLTQRFDLRGVFGVDLVMDFRGNLWPIEVNPRYTASVGLIEKATGVNALKPADGSRRGKPARLSMHGQAVVFAKQKGVAPDLYETFSKDQIADVPEPGRTLNPGAPICTVFAAAGTRDECFKRLKESAKRVYEVVGGAGGSSA